ncbi:MAG: DUF3618 domain-containing protein [Caldilineaceae bacterium]|nr:DUF3618 domain-containing protein [Caldilineaceae bacterium]MCB0095184.1 DUF3618 domain-containing protein [Caldilineaceae bacterium]MCB0140837.1 DUF3618 domain-containing protein [Caldilineaceae bacterium]
MTNHASSEDIREDIQETRRNMGRKIDKIQDHLSTDNLKAQAQAAVNDFATATADSVSDYMRENARDISYTVVDAVKKNPLPSALVGLGLGWLFVEAMSSDRDASAQRAVSRHGTGPAHRHRTGYGYPPPSAPTGRYTNEEGMLQKVGDSVSNAVESAQEKAQEWTEQTREWVGGAAHEAQWRTQQVRDEARLQSHLATMDVQEQAAEWQQQGSGYAQQVGHEVRHYVDQAAEYAGQSVESARETADQVGAYANQIGHQAQSYAQDAGAYVRNRTYDAGVQMDHAIEENPLTFGAIALAIGTAVGLMLPQTRRENRWMGSMSDQVADSARGAASDVMHRAQEAIDEMRPELERTTQKVAEDLQEASDQVTKDVKQTVQSAMRDVKDVAKHTQEVASQKAQKAQDDVTQRAEDARNKGG